ncbi:helix-turn-helix transcriptional regulator [Pseudomonas guariconensis]|uniref:helix-turn-helix transcriptional regulator n=1 Tax=Pseudomonas guariconensis TaxID=1288410 RepID=UPI0034D51CFE
MSITSEEREFSIALGERIARLRKEHGITQTQLAERLGVSQQTIQVYESGERQIR